MSDKDEPPTVPQQAPGATTGDGMATEATEPSLRGPDVADAVEAVERHTRRGPQHSGVVEARTRRKADALVHPSPSEPPPRPDELIADDGPIEQLEGKVLAERYQLNSLVGSGGMGAVYAAHHLTLDTPVAVKVMHPTLSNEPQWARRFQREAKALSALSHRNIVRVMDFGVTDGLHYIVMEMLRGQDVSAWLGTRRALPSLLEVQRIMLQLLDAFEAAHAAGIVHRDLKLDNMFLAVEADGRQFLKILDFGLAYMDEGGKSSTLTQNDMISGTPEYMAPEQCQSLRVTHKADLYAIGCVLTELLQGAPPFRGGAHIEVMTKQMFYEPPPLDRPADAEPVPELLERLRLDLLAKRASSRPADIVEVRRRWLEAMSEEASEARLPGRKNPAGAGERKQRVPQWPDAEPRPSPPQDEPEDHPVIGVQWLGNKGERGVDELCMLGMAAAQMRPKPVTSQTGDAVAAFVLDAGADVPGACAWLAEHVGLQPVVCVRALAKDDLNQLIAAGAGDVMEYPVGADALTKKVKRLLRRKKRRR